MPYRLSFSQTFKSITTFDAIDLPDFVILTGVNGSGKSHLLQSILNKNTILNDLSLHHPLDSILYFPIGQPTLVSGSVRLGDALAYQKQNNRQSIEINYSHIRNNFSYPDDMLDDADRTRFRREYMLLNARRVGFNRSLFEYVENELGIPIEDVTTEEFLTVYNPLLNINPFAVNVAETFMAYHKLWVDNDYARYRFQRGEKVDFLEEEKFEAKYGEQPWKAANQILKQLGLPYSFTAPSSRDVDYLYNASLQADNGISIPLTELSTGESALLAIALSAYSALRWSKEAIFPDVLLLDEADASLHPKMIRSMLDIIKSVLIDTHKVRVIITTHSPTTVALSDEDSIYQMRRSGGKLLEKVKKDNAISALTIGLPTLSVKSENRRQVFVESRNDEQIYTTLFDCIRGELELGISVNFIKIGHEKMGGCGQVIEKVSSLRNAGNTDIYGIIDWDLTNSLRNGVLVAGYGERYSIENYLFDPLIFSYYLLKMKFGSLKDYAKSKQFSHLDFRSAKIELLQDISDELTGKFLESVAIVPDLDRVTLQYINGLSIEVPKEYLRFNGHQMEDQWKVIIPELQRFVQEPKLKLDIARHSYGDIPSFTPKSLVDILISIQNKT